MANQEPLQADQNFFEISKSIVKKFLQSVVVVDDQAEFVEEVDEGVETLINPAGFRGVRSSEVISEPAESPDETSPNENISEVLNIKSLNDCFADNGLVCCVLRPTEQETESIIVKAEHVARRADIVIFDWKLSDREFPIGNTALNCICAILNADAENEGANPQARTRLIAIYTSMLELDEIAVQARDTLAERGIVFEQRDNFNLIRENIRIVFYRKDRGTGVSDLVRQRTVSEETLTDSLINDFTEMTQGLLSNFALASLGVLRENTHRILDKFNPRLDPAYLTHRTLVSPAEEAQQHPIGLLASELNDILEDCKIDATVKPANIKKWLRQKIEKNEIDFTDKVGGISSEELERAFMELVDKGIDLEAKGAGLENWRTALKRIVKKEKDKDSFLTGLLVNDGSAAERDLDFAMLTSLRTQYTEPKPLLTLGTIIAKDGDEKEYFLCIQPLCDSVRLVNDTVFPFLRLENSEKTNERGEVINALYSVVIQDGTQRKKLRINLRPRNVLLLKFAPGETMEVRASLNNENQYIFETSEDIFRWVSTLKFAHAQRAANDFAREISRVGLIESDWLRRMSSK